MEIDANDKDENGNEGSGIDKYYYKKGSDWEEINSNKLPTLESEGITQISIKVVDKAGNETTKGIEIKKDSKAPEFTMEMDITGKTAYGFTVTARAADPRPRKHRSRPSSKSSYI